MGAEQSTMSETESSGQKKPIDSVNFNIHKKEVLNLRQPFIKNEKLQYS